MSRRFVSMLSACLFLAGCAAIKYGPEGPVSREQAMKDGMVSAAPAPLLFQRASYFPGTMGFGGFGAGGDIISGVLVVTESRVSFLKWDEDGGKYRRIWNISRKDITDVAIEKLGKGRRAVIHTDAGFYTVTLGKDDSIFQDQVGTEGLEALLKP